MSDIQPNDKQGQYILDAMESISKNGDAYCSDETLYRCCRRMNKSLTLERYRADKAALLRANDLHIEGLRIYTQRTWAYEESAAGFLADILTDGEAEGAELPASLSCRGITLSAQQREAVRMALSNRLSIVLGGAGSGKTTLIRAIAEHFKGSRVLAAPTGKAARNLTERTGLGARTVHSALGKFPDSDFLSKIRWEIVGLVIVDEASMLTLEMLAGILCKVPHDCRVVLLGDPNQLLSVGAGNVIPDLLALGIPSVRLEQQYRQSEEASALRHNVVEFPRLAGADELAWDESFRFIEADDRSIADIICTEAARRCRAGEDIQVLSPVNTKTDFSVNALNRRLRAMVNPVDSDAPCWNGFYNGDRVVVTKNFSLVFNGDVGVLHFDERLVDFQLLNGNGGGIWQRSDAPADFSLAYALTVHKVQGSQYDTIFLPVSLSTSTMLLRNLLYTAISRAKKEVILVGSREAVSLAMKRTPYPRKSMLVAKTNLLRYRRSA